MELKNEYDVIIVGAGMGGSALAYSLRETDLTVLVLERGPHIKQEAANWDPDEVISRRRYDPDETWTDERGAHYTPRVYYNVGGSSKFFGGTSFRFREADFAAKEYPEGRTEPWPISYADLQGYYDEAERQMWVHGLHGADSTEPPRGEYPHPPLEHEPPISWLASRLERVGLKPFPLPIAVHQGPGGRCRKGSPCDGFPCKIRAKGDGENAFLRPALRGNASIEVVPETRVERLLHDEGGKRVTGVEIEHEGDRRVVSARFVCVAAGAANTAALLLRSASDTYPNGLANGSGQVGRNFMAHNNTVLMALTPFRRNPTWFQKTLAVNDYYLADGERPPLGNIQTRGKVLPQNLKRSARGLPRLLRGYISRHSFDFWVMSEDLPSGANRIELADDGTIRLRRSLNNLDVHRRLVRRFKGALRRAGLPIVLERPPSPGTIQHQVGTARSGVDPATSVVDANCRSHELDNLYIVDGSVFPSSAAVNPALTIAANALRVGAALRAVAVRRGDTDRTPSSSE
jgi:choline dehydrogenase-like flavoprotein